MNPDFHYYATYCAATLAGYSHEDSAAIAASDRFVDRCTETFLTTVKAPLSAATTQLPLELLDTPTDPVGLQKITRIWASFHFLPYDLYAEKKGVSRRYRNKYRLICRPNGSLVSETVRLAKGGSLQAAGLAMLARVPGLDASCIKKSLDMGASGIIVPNIDIAEAYVEVEFVGVEVIADGFHYFPFA